MKKELVNSLGRVFIITEVDNQNQWVYNNWQGYQTYENVVTGALACVELIEASQSRHVLNDNRLVSGPWDHANEWIKTEWMPKAINAGMKYFAHVVSPQTLAALSAQEMSQNAGDYFRMQVFSDIEDAKEWLKNNQG